MQGPRGATILRRSRTTDEQRIRIWNLCFYRGLRPLDTYCRPKLHCTCRLMGYHRAYSDRDRNFKCFRTHVAISTQAAKGGKITVLRSVSNPGPKGPVAYGVDPSLTATSRRLRFRYWRPRASLA